VSTGAGCLRRLAALFAAGAIVVSVGGDLAPSTAHAAGTGIAGAADRWGTVWLCRPGLADDPCSASLTTTVIEPDGAAHVEHAAVAKPPAVDCFYVYPTISGESSVNADLSDGFRQQEVAIAQASGFSPVCRVYAPIYRQITLAALEHPARITLTDALIAYRSVLDAFRDYLVHYNHGRGIVFIGHSQGAVILIKLLQQEVDSDPALRHRLVSALLLGGNVTVPRGAAVGGAFAHIPACGSPRQTGCVVAYSSFSSRPPANSEFGRTTSDAGVGLLAPGRLGRRLAIMCVNPGAPAGGSALLDPALPSLILAFIAPASAAPLSTPWVSFPGSYTARCERSGNATWLQVSRRRGISGRIPSLTALQNPVLGLHVLDLNIALGNLVELVRSEAAAYGRRR
jgi:hypothetical protein